MLPLGEQTIGKANRLHRLAVEHGAHFEAGLLRELGKNRLGELLVLRGVEDDFMIVRLAAGTAKEQQHETAKQRDSHFTLHAVRL